MKLSNKGYLLVEIIVAFTIAMIMTFFLLQITIGLKNLNEDYYVDTKLENDQVLMTKHIMDDINQYELKEVYKNGNDVFLIFKDNDEEFTKRLSVDDKIFMYGKCNEVTKAFIEDTLFTKTFDDSLNISEPVIDIMCFNGSGYSSCVGDEEHKQLSIKFSAKTIYSDVDYGISLNIPFSYNDIIVNSCIDDVIEDDNSGANEPEMFDNLIPVKYSSCKNAWVKADVTKKDWYNYDNKQWANAVLVSSSSRDSYKEAGVGAKIDEADILAQYVWIPRYKYKVWNVNKVMGVDSYNAEEKGIDIVFESGTNTSGSVTCTDTLYETCSGTNGSYYTHPSFTFGGKQLKGIWVGKFELSSERPNLSYSGGNRTDLTVRIVASPSTSSTYYNSWRNNSIGNFFTVISDMQKPGNIYGLNSNKSVMDSHMLKGIDWGAIIYFAHSKYGLCDDGSCSAMSLSNGWGTISKLEQLDNSSTLNQYGIYNLAGGAWEYVMFNMSATSGSVFVFKPRSSDFDDNFYNVVSNRKYMDVIGGTDGTKSKLGDGLYEVIKTTGDPDVLAFSYTTWNNCDFTQYLYSNHYFDNGEEYYLGSTFLVRGGAANIGVYGSSVCEYNFYAVYGEPSNDRTSRAVLVVY